MRIVEIGGTDEFLQLGQEVAFTTEVYMLLREQKMTLVAVPQERSEEVSKVWLSTIELGLPILEGLKKEFFEHPILSLPYKTTHLYIDQGGYTLVPNDLDDSGTPQLWSMLHSSVEEQYVLSQPIPSEQMTLHYTVPLELYHFCQRSFSLPTYNHTLQPLISCATRLSRQREPQLVMMRVGKSVVDVLYVADGRLQLANRYQISSEMDLLYFITALWRQFLLSPEIVPLYLYKSDSTFLTDAFIEQLREHISRIEMNYYPELICSVDTINEHSAVLPPEFILQLLCE